MAQASSKVASSKIALSACNVRRIKAGVSIEQLADDIARRTLLQSITVRPVLDADGNETGFSKFRPAGAASGRLNCWSSRSAWPRTCSARRCTRSISSAPSWRCARRGQSEEEIAAAFFVSVSVVKQRLRLASVSPKLLDVYAEDGMTLDQLMAFTVSGDWERQEQVWERLQCSYSKEPYAIRRQLTEGAVRASDKRARFIGEAYEAEGGSVLRDLFQGDDGGWLQDVALIDRLVAERLEREANAIRAEGWKWIEIAPDFPYGHSFGRRQLRGEEQLLSAGQEAERDALQAEYDRLETEHENMEELPEEIDRRLGEIEAALAVFEDLPVSFDPAEVARAGAFVTIGPDGRLLVQRGFVRPEDELPVEQEPEINGEGGEDSFGNARVDGNGSAPAVAMRVGTDDQAEQASSDPAVEPEEEDGIKPLPDRLLTELTAHRTLVLRYALGDHPEVAFLAALHALCLKLFYHYALDSCLELDVKSVAFTAQAPGLNDTGTAQMLTSRHQFWLAALPRQPEELWDALSRLDHPERQSLFAHSVGLSVNAVHEAYNRRPRALAHADVLAGAVELDMVAAGWTPTVDSYLGRVTKARILQAVREATRKVPQIAFKPDFTRHKNAAPFKRNDLLLETLPIGLVVFPGSGISDNLGDKAKKLGIPVLDYRKEAGA